MHDHQIADDFLYETDAGAATWLLGVLSKLKPISECDGDQLIFQRASEMLKRISDADSIDPAKLDIDGEGRLRSTAENDTLAEAYSRAFENGQCIVPDAPHLSAFAAGYLLGLRPHGLVGLPALGVTNSEATRDNVMHGVTVEVLLDQAGYTPPGGWGKWSEDGQVDDSRFADPENAAHYRQGVKAARNAADTYLVLRSLADDQ